MAGLGPSITALRITAPAGAGKPGCGCERGGLLAVFPRRAEIYIPPGLPAHFR